MLGLVHGPEARQRVMQKPSTAFNTNPFMAGPLSGIAAHYERAGSDEADRSLGVLQSSFGSAGDSFFWRLLRPGASVLAVALGTFRPWLAPAAFLLAFAVPSQAVRFVGLGRGLSQGRTAAVELSQQLARHGARLDLLFAVLAGMLTVRSLLAVGPAYVVAPVALVSWALSLHPRLGSLVFGAGLLGLLGARLVL
jgi:mannose/fructose/N-acetylgalactosamine-specific phosphotransferase system component IID